ncbi:MAG: PTS system mannose/fructose/sorbose family transporter subunit IID [Oscillospiraceae bacterium]|nr:PTS system mannose/fructose/sorbose family transporter subunit IID [Oscillospiraceae bacterium]
MAKTNKKLSEAALKKAANRHNWTLQWCWNYERMQASGFAYAMVPIMQELYDTNDEVCENLERHMQFYNCHPGASAIIMGASVALEEDYQPEMSDSIKVALMGPLAGIGDTVQAVLVQPITYIIAASLANEGSLLAVPVVIIPLLILFLLRWPLFRWGYNRSVKIIEDISGNSDFNSLREAAQILGLTVVGGFVPSMIGVKLKYAYTKELTNEAGEAVTKTIALQDTLDGILPYLLPICLVGLCYWLLKTKKISPVKVILIVAVLAFVLGALGIMG